MRAEMNSPDARGGDHRVGALACRAILRGRHRPQQPLYLILGKSATGCDESQLGKFFARF